MLNKKGSAPYWSFLAPNSMGCGTDTQGVALCHQVRSFDIKARKGRFKEQLPEPVLDLVLDKLRAVLD